jgi:hypothetical protein
LTGHYAEGSLDNLEIKQMPEHFQESQIAAGYTAFLNYFPEPIVRVSRAMHAKLFRKQKAKPTPEDQDYLRELLSLKYTTWIRKYGVPDLLYAKPNELILNMATLQRINLCDHQKKISELVKEIMMQKSETENDDGTPYKEWTHPLNWYMQKYSR